MAKPLENNLFRAMAILIAAAKTPPGYDGETFHDGWMSGRRGLARDILESLGVLDDVIH